MKEKKPKIRIYRATLGKDGKYYYYSTYPNSPQKYRMGEKDYLRLVNEYQEKAIEIERNEKGLIVKLIADTAINYENRGQSGPIHIHAEINDTYITTTARNLNSNQILNTARTSFTSKSTDEKNNGSSSFWTLLKLTSKFFRLFKSK